MEEKERQPGPSPSSTKGLNRKKKKLKKTREGESGKKRRHEGLENEPRGPPFFFVSEYQEQFRAWPVKRKMQEDTDDWAGE